MANPKPTKAIHIYEEKYREQKSRIWKGFNQYLGTLQDAYDVTVKELADGLMISRQKFYDFRAAPEKGLSIDQTALIILWECLSDPGNLKDKRMSAEIRKKRETLRQEGPNHLLKAAGFSAIENDEESERKEKATLKTDTSLDRIKARLNSSWIEDGLRKAQIIDSIFDLVKDKGRLDKTLHTQPISAIEALGWLEGHPLDVTDQDVLRMYKDEIRRLARSGKNQFVGAELFELYQNILEYLSIDSYGSKGMRITSCQFRILSAPLPASVQDIFEEFSQIYQNAEIALLQLLCNLTDFDPNALSQAELFTPVVRAQITSYLDDGKKEKLDDRKKEKIVWRYSSTGTHLENMLSAIKLGLGHSLEMTGFSIHAMGPTAKSLARVSIGLAERNDDGTVGNVYQGWWVGSNAIISVLTAAVIATKDWLYSQAASRSHYFTTCKQLGDIDNKLYLIRENVHEFFFRSVSDYFKNSEYSDEETFFKTAETRILEIENGLSVEQQQPSFRDRNQALKNRLFKTKLTRMRLALKKSAIGAATHNLDDVKSFIATYENDNLSKDYESEEEAYRHILFLQASECVMLYNFYAGDREFLNGKLWRYRPRYKYENGLKKLGKYIKAVGALNFDTFSCASQVFGNIGILELYMAQEKDTQFLQQAAENLLWAAHYSQRIGYVRRATYWLTHASRVYCRLGELEKSERLSTIAQAAANSVHQDHQEELEYDSRFKDFIAAIKTLTEGERFLANQEPTKAILSFLNALDVFVNIHATDRLTADTLYGLYRASQVVDDEVGHVFEILKDNFEYTQPDPGMRAILEKIIQSLKQIPPEASWKSISPKFKELAKSIWHHWVEEGSEASETHPIEDAMDRDQFLIAVKKSD
ncbi:hypothetical protein N836_24390 [Leptolyngbya sp. Heron Island J]|uniref:hypothetical protein n=1 Tax=Leptolyngbya sp. Heron Island J TaxID=1385935 RepID=UPI0003B9539D|nr:hypothetical protein [Leptolyngbya sp. Heron Island J]ESA32753.1 hypothetical protein N836_24390 [Leptolyngbya sp. Heron Island J]